MIHIFDKFEISQSGLFIHHESILHFRPQVSISNCPNLDRGGKSCSKERYNIDGQTHQKGYCHTPEYGHNHSQYG